MEADYFSWQQTTIAIDQMTDDALENLSQASGSSPFSLAVAMSDPIRAGRGGAGRGGAGDEACVGSREQPVFAAKFDRPNGALDIIVAALSGCGNSGAEIAVN